VFDDPSKGCEHHVAAVVDDTFLHGGLGGKNNGSLFEEVISDSDMLDSPALTPSRVDDYFATL
jgi:hypothetical protein